MKVKCKRKNCDVIFYVRPSHASLRKYCSRNCRRLDGWFSDKTRSKLKNNKPNPDIWIGRKHTEETKKKMSEVKLINPTRYWLGRGEESKKHGTGK